MKENLYNPDHIRTFTGIYINPFTPDSDKICIEDIAHALSQIPRFGGHLPGFYSVAQHSIEVSYQVKDKLTGLLHDASEAYLYDIPKPLKFRMPEYIKAEKRLMALISDKFGFKFPLPKDVKLIDRVQLEWEWNTLMLISPIRINFAKKQVFFENKFLELFHLYSK